MLVYHIQSGLLREFEAPNNDMNGLFEDVDEAKEEECLLTAVENFNKEIGQDEEYVGCASCGIICRSSLCDKIQLGNHALDHLVLCAEFTKWWKNYNQFFEQLTMSQNSVIIDYMLLHIHLLIKKIIQDIFVKSAKFLKAFYQITQDLLTLIMECHM